MEIKQQSHLKMLITTRDVLDNFKTVWQSIGAFVTARADFGVAIGNIQAQELKRPAPPPAALDKHARVSHVRRAAVVGGAVAAYADKQGDHELFAPWISARPI